MDDLIKALQISRKYTDSRYPTQCEHDRLAVMVDPAGVTDDDEEELYHLGFVPDVEEQLFYSFRFGSC